jgi:hypothetical protein
VTVVFDTNVVIAALVANGLCREVLHRAIRLRILATSDPLLNELDATLRERFHITPSVAAFLDLFRASIRVVEAKPLPERACRDATDDMVLAAAVAAEADAIVTGDQDLLVLGSYNGIAIVSPRSFLERLDRMALPPGRD